MPDARLLAAGGMALETCGSRPDGIPRSPTFFFILSAL
jgi:hypothetical protein